jgi:putative flavoprotein involved in K+ transport
MYALGLPFMRKRKSSFIHGAEDDTQELTAHIAGYLNELSLRRISHRHGAVG